MHSPELIHCPICDWMKFWIRNFKLNLLIDRCKFIDWWLQLIDGKSTPVHVMTWCQAITLYPSQLWPISILPYVVTRPQWVNISWQPKWIDIYLMMWHLVISLHWHHTSVTAFQITGNLTIYSKSNKQQSSDFLPFVRRISMWPVDFHNNAESNYCSWHHNCKAVITGLLWRECPCDWWISIT